MPIPLSTFKPNAAGVGGGAFQTSYVADPDIAAQAAAQGQLQQAQFANQQHLQDQQLQWQRDRFNTVYGNFQNQMGQMGNIWGNGGATATAPGTQGPPLGGNQVWGAQQVKQNLNANNAMVDRSVATQNQNTQQQLAGRGFGANSPLAMALQNQSAMSGLGQKQDYARQFVPETQQQNASYGLQVGQAREAQFAARQNEQINRQRTAQQAQSSLLSALAGLV